MEGRENGELPAEISTEDYFEMIQLYLKGVPIKEIAEKFKMSHREAKELVGRPTPEGPGGGAPCIPP